MPNGFGFNWPGHTTTSAYGLLASVPIKSGSDGMFTATIGAIRQLAAADGVRLPASAPPSGGSTGSAGTAEGGATAAGSGAGAAGSGAAGSSASNAPATSGSSPSGSAAPSSNSGSSGTDAAIGAVALGLLVLAAVGLGIRFAVRQTGPIAVGPRWLLPSAAVLSAALLVGIILVSLSASSSTAGPLAHNPYIDPGTSLPERQAPDFTLINQYGQPVSLHQFRGKVVILTFNDSECTTICPLTTEAMLYAKRALGAAASKVQLLGVDADPKAIAVDDVLSYTQLHGMVNQWQYLTGTLPQLRHVWNQYGVAVDITRGLISHTPALYVIDAQGRLRKVYITQQSYAAVGQFGQVLAHEAASLIPGHPPVHSNLSYVEIKGISPSQRITVPRAGGGTVPLGPSAAPRLYVFFATWDQEVSSLAGELDLLNHYRSEAQAAGLPSLTAVDEGSVEPSASALPDFLRTLPDPLSYPVGIDTTGRIADGYEVEGQPWFVLTSASGQILWYWEVYTAGWPKLSALERDLRAALAKAPTAPSGVVAAEHYLVHSPPALVSLHRQANNLLGWASAFDQRVRSLRGYPVVVNTWASWCTSCQAEYSLFKNASIRYGRQVAFLGVDAEDQTSNAQAFMSHHWLAYPSYQSLTGSGLQEFLPGGLVGLPTTFFINRAGKVVEIHTGQYASQGTLDADIEQYALHQS